MSSLVRIPSICKDSWLHWSPRGNSSCLRDFRTCPPQEIRGYSTREILGFLREAGAQWIQQIPRVPHKNEEFWRDYITRLNNGEQPDAHPVPDRSVPARPGPAPVERAGRLGLAGQGRVRMLDAFRAEFRPLLETGNVEALRGASARWVRELGCVRDKELEFNHWDSDEPGEADQQTGIGWTGAMLRWSRAGGQLHYISTGKPDLDFALLSHDLHLGIAAHENEIRFGERDFIKPDGLGVRQDGSFCVLEVKGPQDEADLIGATLQALCGALAVYAKRDNIVQIARQAWGLRPAVPNAAISDDGRTLGVYVMVSERNYAWSDRTEKAARLIVEACRPVREVAYFKLPTYVKKAEGVFCLPTERVFAFGRCVESPSA